LTSVGFPFRQLEKVGEADPRASIYSIIQILSLPAEVVGDFVKLMDLEQSGAVTGRMSTVQILLTVPKSVVDDDFVFGAPAIKVDRDVTRLHLVLRFSDVGAKPAAGGPNAGSPNPSALAVPSPNLSGVPATGQRRGIGATTPSPNLPGTPRSLPSPQQTGTPTSARPGGAGAPGEKDAVYFYNYSPKSFFQTFLSAKEAAERLLVPLTALPDLNAVLKQFGINNTKVNALYAIIVQRAANKQLPDADRRIAGIVAKLLERPVAGFMDKFMAGSIGSEGDASGSGRPASGGPSRGGTAQRGMASRPMSPNYPAP
jgi:hypothetical protein